MIDIAQPLYFIRHGQTDWNAETRYQGITDTTLSEIGRGQAAENASFLQDLLEKDGIAPDQLTVMTSPLLRAKQTAEIIGQSFDSPSPPPSKTGISANFPWVAGSA